MADRMNDDVTAVSTSTDDAESQSREGSLEGVSAPAGTGPILEKDELEVCKIIDTFWTELDSWAAPYIARWKANAMRRQGAIGVHVVKPDPNRNEYKVWAPPGASKVPPTFNQAARLCRRLVSNLFVDKPLPEATPGTATTTDDPDAAEFQTRLLQDITTTPDFDVPRIAARCVGKACTYDSGFALVYVDPKGGGRRPRSIMASKAATTVKDALYVDGDDETPQPGPYVQRYVMPLEPPGVPGDELLTDDPAEADLEWLPGLRHQRLTGVNVRPISKDATDIETCPGIVIRVPVKLGDLKNQYEELTEMTAEELWDLAGSRPGNVGAVLRPDQQQLPKRTDEEPPPDHTLIIVTSVYIRDGGDYPWGAYAVMLGTKKLVHRQEWAATVNGVKEALPIPLAQFKGFEEGEDDFYGVHLMHLLGPGNEIRAASLGGAIEHMDRFNRRKVFYSPQTLFQPKAAQAQTGTMVPIADGTQPKVEEMPEYPRVGMEIFDRATTENNDESGLAPIAQGQTDPSVQSGLHAQKIIEQVNVGLSDIKQSTEAGIQRLWTIAALLVRAFYTVPMQVQFRGDDQEYKQKEWSAADLANVKDVRIMKGSFTMLAPSAKIAVAEYMAKLGVIDQNRLQELAAGNIGGLMGLQDDPALVRIRRQLSRWYAGPPKAEDPSEEASGTVPTFPGNPANIVSEEGLENQLEAPPAPGIAPLGAPPALDPAVVGSIAPVAPPAPDPVQLALADIFKPSKNDEEPAIAKIRFRELSRAMCSTKYERQPDAWRAGFDAEYDRMRKAAGVGTAAEAAQQQAEAAKAAQQAEQQKVKLEQESKAALEGQRIDADREKQIRDLEHDSVITDAKLTAEAAKPAPSRPAPQMAGAR